MSKYDAIIGRWLDAYPMSAHYSGIHDYDGRLNSFDPEFISDRIRQVILDLEELENLGVPETTPEEPLLSFEHFLIFNQLTTELYNWQKLQEHTKSPLPFIFQIGIVEESYTVRSFDTITNRLKSVIGVVKHIPELLKQATHHLSENGKPKSLAKPKLEMSIQVMSGMINFYQDKLIEFAVLSEDESLIDEWSEANTIAVEAMEEFKKSLEEEYLPISHDDFRLGQDKFSTLLNATEGVDLDINTLLSAGERELDRNYDMMIGCAKDLGFKDVPSMIEEMDIDYPNPQDLFCYIEESLERAKNYVHEKEVLTIPEEHIDKQCDVIAYPESQRAFAFAAMNLPGPFEVPEAAEAYYYVNPVDPAWTPEKVHQHMTLFSRGGIEFITVHEAWPGHYLQLLYSYTTPSRIANLLSNSYALIEGWGLYAEEMMFEAGYDPLKEGGNRPRYHVGQLREALLRDVRYIVAIRMHCFDMTIEEAVELFMTKSFLSESNAKIEANRGTVDPLYLNYTLGKLMIKKLRVDYEKECKSKSQEFSLKKFHNTLLSYGSPPITVLRRMVLENESSKIL